MRKPLPLGAIVMEYLEKQGFLPRVQVYEAMMHFGEWFPDLASWCTPAKFVRGVLFLEVRDPLYLCEVESRIEYVLSELQKRGIPVEAIKVRVRPRGDST